MARINPERLITLTFRLGFALVAVLSLFEMAFGHSYPVRRWKRSAPASHPDTTPGKGMTMTPYRHLTWFQKRRLERRLKRNQDWLDAKSRSSRPEAVQRVADDLIWKAWGMRLIDSDTAEEAHATLREAFCQSYLESGSVEQALSRTVERGAQIHILRCANCKRILEIRDGSPPDDALYLCS
jgi:hypothetical protein